MNKLLNFAAILSLFLAIGCKEDNGGSDNPDPDPEVPGAELAGIWVAERDNAVSGPAADQFTDFELNITATANDGVKYTATGNGEKIVFPDQGSLDGIDADDNFEAGTEVTRKPDDVSMDITLSDNGQTLTLKFTISQDASINTGNARVAGIAGEYVFILDKQEQEQTQ